MTAYNPAGLWRVRGWRGFARLALDRPALRTSDSPSFNCFLDRNAVFVHVPKTAGISIAHALFDCRAGGHTTFREYQSIFAPDALANMFKFTFVRNPFDSLFSAYTYLRAGGRNRADRAFNRDVLSRFADFRDFVMRGLSDPAVSNYVHFRPPMHFLCDQDGDLGGLDYIGRYETLASDFAHVRDRVRPGAQLAHFNRTTRAQAAYRTAYTIPMIDRVFDRYGDSIARLGYGFEGIERPVRTT